MNTTNDTTADTPDVLDIEDVAKFLRCSVRHVRKLLRDRAFPAPVRLGSLVRWSRAVVVRWLESNTGAGDSGATANRGGRKVQVR